MYNMEYLGFEYARFENDRCTDRRELKLTFEEEYDIDHVLEKMTHFLNVLGYEVDGLQIVQKGKK